MTPTPEPPKGYRIISEEEQRTKPLPMDAVCYDHEFRPEWRPSNYRGMKVNPSLVPWVSYATRAPLPGAGEQVSNDSSGVDQAAVFEAPRHATKDQQGFQQSHGLREKSLPTGPEVEGVASPRSETSASPAVAHRQRNQANRIGGRA